MSSSQLLPKRVLLGSKEKLSKGKPEGMRNNVRNETEANHGTALQRLLGALTLDHAHESTLSTLESVSSLPVSRGNLDVLKLVMGHLESKSSAVQDAASRCALKILVKDRSDLVDFLLEDVNAPVRGVRRRCVSMQCLRVVMTGAKSDNLDLEAEKLKLEEDRKGLPALKERAKELGLKIKLQDNAAATPTAAGSLNRRGSTLMRDMLKDRLDNDNSRLREEFQALCTQISQIEGGDTQVYGTARMFLSLALRSDHLDPVPLSFPFAPRSARSRAAAHRHM